MGGEGLRHAWLVRYKYQIARRACMPKAMHACMRPCRNDNASTDISTDISTDRTFPTRTPAATTVGWNGSHF